MGAGEGLCAPSFLIPTWKTFTTQLSSSLDGSERRLASQGLPYRLPWLTGIFDLICECRALYHKAYSGRTKGVSVTKPRIRGQGMMPGQLQGRQDCHEILVAFQVCVCLK